jgi:predicted dehydrogenase
MRLGLIGCGLIGHKRLAAAAGHQLVQAADPNADAARGLTAKFGGGWSTDPQDVIAADVDLVIVATPHDALAKWAIAALEAGKHVLVEKPAGRTVGEIRAIADAAARCRRFCKVGFNHRFHPAFLKARAIVDAGGIGDPLYVRGRYGHGGRLGMEREWRCDREKSGGGQGIDQAPHLIDLSRWFLGDLELAFGFAPTQFWDMTVEDNVHVALRGTGDRIAWLHASWTEWKNLFSFEIFGRVGKLAIDGLGGSYGVERLTWYQMTPAMGPPETTIWEYPGADDSFALEFQDMMQAIADGRAPQGGLDDALAVAVVIEKLYADTGR